MLRYLKLYLHFLRFSFSRAMEFRVDFFFRIIMDVFYYVVNIGFFKVIYLHTPALAGWTENQTMLFVAIFLMIDAIYMTVFSGNLWQMPWLINSGGLDYYLTRPVSTLFFLSTREFAANSFINLLMTAGIMVWAIGLNPEVLSAGNILLLIFLIGIGELLQYLICMLYIIPVFWIHSGRGFSDAYHVFSRFMEKPDRIFRGVLRIFITFVLPLALIASFPARLYLEPFDPLIMTHLVAVTAAFAGLVLWLWNKGLRAYSSASS